MTAGLRGSSSGMPASILPHMSAPTSAALVLPTMTGLEALMTTRNCLPVRGSVRVPRTARCAMIQWSGWSTFTHHAGPLKSLSNLMSSRFIVGSLDCAAPSLSGSANCTVQLSKLDRTGAYSFCSSSDICSNSAGLMTFCVSRVRPILLHPYTVPAGLFTPNCVE